MTDRRFLLGTWIEMARDKAINSTTPADADLFEYNWRNQVHLYSLLHANVYYCLGRTWIRQQANEMILYQLYSSFLSKCTKMNRIICYLIIRYVTSTFITWLVKVMFQLTMWGPNAEINDYARKEWAGIIIEYYAKRWTHFVSELELSILTGKPIQRHDFVNKVINLVERPFCQLKKTVNKV